MIVLLSSMVNAWLFVAGLYMHTCIHACARELAGYVYVRTYKYRLDAEAKGSTGFRILKTHIKSRGRQPEDFMMCLENSKTVDPIG